MKIRDVPFLPMGGLYESDDLEAVMRVVTAAAQPGGDFFPLPEENAFQRTFAAHEGAKKAIAVNSCGTALDCCMMALDIKPGDEVITTPLTFVCTAGTAIARGAKVVFADIDPVTMNLAPVQVRARITEKTKAIIPVHFSGLACDIDAFDAITRETGIPVIYDAAHAVGAKYKGQLIGRRGQAACYSFQSNKNITCLGEGGAVTTDDENFAERVRQLKTFGYVYGGPALRVASIGFNYRMTKAQYAVGLTQLAKIDRIIQQRQERMVLLNHLLSGVKEVILPAGHGPDHASHLYVLRVNTDSVAFTASAFAAHLKQQYKVGTAKHYPAVWTWEAFAKLGYTGAGCPLAAKACEQVVSMPIFPATAPETVEYLAWAVKQTIVELKGGV
ncbi:MAG: DegT/DnrJ/EryC1/StrS family aminotransferase [Kiritimatiellia bacterium]|nr:DegT/DnrJ/EryC1/StrS family aminotransferase [Kiritimatiellia bacterium]